MGGPLGPDCRCARTRRTAGLGLGLRLSCRGSTRYRRAGSTRPGFMIPCGSSACLRLRISAIATGGL